MNELTSEQYSIIMSKVTTLVIQNGASAINSFIDRAMSVIGKNLTPFVTQLQLYLKDCEFFGKLCQKQH
jgi:hypothetical protein